MIRLATTLLLLAVVFASNGESAKASHPFHVTRAEIEYNAKRKTFEVAICVWPEDLERAVSKLEKRSVKIDDETEANRDKMFCRYVAKTFQFTAQPAKADGEDKPSATAKIRWIGSELEIKQGWLYFEVDANQATTSWKIANRMFFELNDDQLNQAQIRNGKTIQSETLSALKPAANWALK